MIRSPLAMARSVIFDKKITDLAIIKLNKLFIVKVVYIYSSMLKPLLVLIKFKDWIYFT